MIIRMMNYMLEKENEVKKEKEKDLRKEEELKK